MRRRPLSSGSKRRLGLWAAALCGLQCLGGVRSGFPQERVQGNDFIRVTEESWKVGEVRSYTLQFDRVTFGREAIRLMERKGTGRGRRMVFGQTLTLDLRAVGQEGFLTLRTTIQYRGSREALAYLEESELQDRPAYSTYPKSAFGATRTSLDLDMGVRPFQMLWVADGRSRIIPVPPGAGDMLVDPLSMVTWERLFVGDSWKVGDARPLSLLLPSGLERFDYHLDARRRGPPAPERIRATMMVEKRESVEIFSVPIPAFRCRIPEMGLSMWVSGSGGILKYDDGRGLVVSLEQ